MTLQAAEQGNGSTAGAIIAHGKRAPRVTAGIAAHAGLLVVLALYVVLGVVYSRTTPIFEASDEVWHYPFIKHLADGNGLPVQRADQVGPWRQEGSQPPLYYALGALATCWIDTSDMDSVRWINPHANMGIPTADRNVNMVIHPAGQPLRGTVLAVHLVRWMSVLMGAVTVVMGYLLARQLLQDSIVATAAAALTAFNPMFLFITSSVNNDALVIMLSAIAIWLMVRIVLSLNTEATPQNDAATERGHYRQFVLLGVVLGLTSLSKASGLALLPLAAVTGAAVAWRKRSWKELLLAGVLIGAPVLLIGGWWYYRNWQLYRDPLGLNAFISIVGGRYPQPTLLQLASEWKGFVMSYWGFFGGMNVPAPEWFYTIASVLALLGLAGVPLYIWRVFKPGRNLWRWLALGLVILWPAAVFVSLIRWTLMTIASQGRLMFSALTALSLLMAMGLAALIPRRLRALLPGSMSAFLLVGAVLLPAITIAPAYAPPDILTERDVATLSPRINATFGDKMRLLGYEIDKAEAAPGDTVNVTLYWKALAPMHENYSVFMHLLGTDELILGQRDMYPGQGTYPTTLWSPGEIVADTYAVPVSPTAMTPGEAFFAVGLYNLQTGERLPVVDGMGEPIGDHLRFGRLVLPPRMVEGIPNPVYFNLDNQVALIGYELDRTSAAPGEAFNLTLYWKALRDLDTNYSVFTHVLGEQQSIWAQMDSWPLRGDAPTATWKKGQVIRDPYELVVRPDAPAGTFELEVGMYGAQDGKRLPLLGEGGHVQDVRILLGQVRILPGEE
jgi:4-amino-4-deoxy-L-arabinose transferase-like glycosyltransferase